MTMDSVISAVSALAGAVIGGVTMFVTNWTTQTAQLRHARLSADRATREDLYGKFMEEVALGYSKAFATDHIEYGALVRLFALKGRIILVSTPPVVAEAERALQFLVDLYSGPVLTQDEVREMMQRDGGDKVGVFARACRQEMRDLGLG
jgi:hypothetical protein